MPQKALVSILLLAALPYLSFAENCRKDKDLGVKMAAEQHSSTGYLLNGFGAGLCLWFLGYPISFAAASASDPQPDTIPDSIEYVACFKLGYTQTSKTKNLTAARDGSLAGAVIVSVAVLAFILSGFDGPVMD